MHVVLMSDDNVRLFIWVIALYLVANLIGSITLWVYLYRVVRTPPRVYLECPHPTIHTLLPHSPHWAPHN